jgi:hypothetical protein
MLPALLTGPPHPTANFDTEFSSQRGPQAISGTYEGARATAGSSAWWNLAQKDSIGGAVVSTNIEAYGPTPGRPNLVRRGDDPFGRRSVAFTNIAPNSAAQAFAGNGPAAVASGKRCSPGYITAVHLHSAVCANSYVSNFRLYNKSGKQPTGFHIHNIPYTYCQSATPVEGASKYSFCSSC